MAAEETLRVVLLHRIDRNSSPSEWSLSRGDGDAATSSCRVETALSGSCRPAVCLLRQVSGRVYFVGKYRSGLKESSFSAWSVFQEIVRQALCLERTSRPLCIYSPRTVETCDLQAGQDCARGGSSDSTSIAQSPPSTGAQDSSSPSSGVVLLRGLSELLSQSKATVLQVAVSTSPVRRRVMNDLESAFGIPPLKQDQQAGSPAKQHAEPSAPLASPESESGSGSAEPSVRSSAHVSRVIGLFEAAAANAANARVTRQMSAIAAVNLTATDAQRSAQSPSIVASKEEQPPATQAAVQNVHVAPAHPRRDNFAQLVAQEAHRALVGLQTIMAKQKTTASPVRVSGGDEGSTPSFARALRRPARITTSACTTAVGRTVSTSDAGSRENTTCEKSESRVEVTVDYRSKSTRSILHRRSFRQKKVQRRSVGSVGEASVHRPQSMCKVNTVSLDAARQDVAKVTTVRDRPKSSSASIPSRRWSSYVEGRATLNSSTSPVHLPHPPSALNIKVIASEPGSAVLSWDPPPAASSSSKVLGYAVYLNEELEVTTEGADTCDVQLVELEPCRHYTITVKSRGATEDSLPSPKLIYTHREGGRSSSADLPTPSSEPPSRPLSTSSQHSHNSVFVVTHTTRAPSNKRKQDVAGEPQAETMVALQKELRSLLTLSVNGSGDENASPVINRTSSSSSNSSGISAGSWSSSPMQDTAIHSTLPSRRSQSVNSSRKARPARSPSPATYQGATEITFSELQQAVQQRHSQPVIPSQSRILTKRQSSVPANMAGARTSSATSVPSDPPLPSCCEELSPLSLEWDESYGSHLSAAELISSNEVVTCTADLHQGSWV